MMMIRSGGRLRGVAAALAALWGVVVLGWLAPAVHAQGPNRTATKFYPDFSDTADALLRNAASHVRDGQWAEAIEIYQRVIQQFGDKVAKLPKDDPASDPTGESSLYVDLRQFCQRRLAALPAAARAIYRGRVDGQAEHWFQQGRDQRDRALLRRVVDQAFCSSWGDDALELLGDFAFQDGRFDEALTLYRQIVPDGPAERSGLVYPDPSVDQARVAAKNLLCRAALGGDPADRAGLDAYSKAYPNASGLLAGRNGPYLQTLAEALKGDQLAPPAQPDGRWPTFAGAPTRTKVVPGAIDVGSLQWRVELPIVDPKLLTRHGMRAMGVATTQTPPDRLLAYHPIVLGDQVLVCDENRVIAFNLNDRPGGGNGTVGGVPLPVKPSWQRDEGEGGGVSPAARTTAGVPRYTLTAYGDKIYARMGPTNWPYIGGMGRVGAEAHSYILALDRATEGKLLWRKQAVDVPLPRRPAEGTNRSAGFEGTPLADARNVFVAMTDRREQTATYVVCLDAENQGNLRWVRYIGAASSEADNMMGMGFGMGMGMAPTDFGHRLLSLDGPTVYYQTNLGAVVALDAETGAIKWVATYPRQERQGFTEGHDRDLNPAVVHDGLVIVAPDDAAAIYAFDAASGRLVWKTDPIPDEVRLAHLLGVAKGRLVATGDRVLLFDVKTGKLLSTWPDGGGRAFTGYGRGLLAGDKIYWPTKTEIHVLDQAAGLRTDPPLKLAELFQTTGGNLAVGDGYLIVAQADGLVVYCQNSRLIERYRDQIARVPDQAANYFRLAQAAEAVGRDPLALEALDQAFGKARPSETIDGQPLAEAVRKQQYHLLMKLGNQARAARDPDQAALRYEAAAGRARLERDRLSARLALATAQVERGDPRGGVATLQSVLADGRLSALSVPADDGHRTIRAHLLIADRLATLLKERGRDLYAEFDREARALLEKGKAQHDARLLEEVGRTYPVAQVVPAALLALGALDASRDRPAAAARAYKRLLTQATTDADRARALLGLALAYEAQRLWVPARDAYVQAGARFSAEPIEERAGSGGRVGAFVADRLRRPPFDRMAADSSEPSLPVPLDRRWARTLAGTFRPVVAEGTPPAVESGRIFLAHATMIQPIDPATGAPGRGADLKGPVVWVGYLADKIIAATENRIVALGIDMATEDWKFEVPAPDRDRRGANPFARPSAGGNGDGETADVASGRLHDFKVVAGRVFCLSGNRRLLAFDGDTGLLDWSYAPPSAPATINPNVWIGPRRIVLQARKPNGVLVLETATGRRLAEYAQPEEGEWARPPLPIDDDHVALVPDRLTVALFDLNTGANSWVFRESEKLPTHGPPRLLGDAERLLVVHDGNTLVRLDAATGTKRWSRPLGSEDLGERPEAFALDAQRVYWANGPTIRAANLTDGLLAWNGRLAGAEAGWSLALTAQCVLAYPGTSGRTEGEGEGLPLVFRRREDGTLVQRLIFPANVTEVAVRLAPRGALVATQSALWALGDRTPAAAAAAEGRKP